MTRAELLQLQNHYLNEVTTSFMAESSTTYFDKYQALQMGLDRYYRETKCSLVNYTLAATIGTSIYAHSAFGGVGTPGSRIFDLRFVAFDETELKRVDTDWLDRYDPKWRFAGNATPLVWVPWGEKQFRLWYTPSATSNIYIEGWETPASTVFDTDTDEPPVELTDQPLIAMYGALVCATKGIENNDMMRMSALWPALEKGWQRAYSRIHNSGPAEIIFGRYSDDGLSDTGVPTASTIINI